MDKVLSGKSKLGFVVGTIKKPAKEGLTYTQWFLYNNMLLSKILNSISETIASNTFSSYSADDNVERT